MGYVRNKIATSFFYAIDFGHVVQHHNSAATQHGRRTHIKNPSGQYGASAHVGGDSATQRLFYASEQVRIANRLHQRVAGLHGSTHQPLHHAIRPVNTALRIDGNHRLFHTVEDGFHFLATILQGAKDRFHASRRRIQRVGNCRNFVDAVIDDSRTKISARQTMSKIDNPGKAARYGLRQQSCQQNCQQQSQQCGPQ